MITAAQYDVLAHASQNDGRYVTGDPAVLAMAADGLLFDHGPWALAGGDHALRLTTKGREAVKEYRASLPRPKPLTKRQLRAKDRWEEFANWREAWGGTFPQWLALRKGIQP